MKLIKAGTLLRSKMKPLSIIVGSMLIRSATWQETNWFLMSVETVSPMPRAEKR